jgi:hypothetical protein
MARRGVQGNMAAQARIMGHDAVAVTFGATIAGTESRGVALYVGAGPADITVRGVALYVGAGPADITVKMESGNPAVFKAVPAGTFMPILVTEVTTATGATAADILAIY